MSAAKLYWRGIASAVTAVSSPVALVPGVFPCAMQGIMAAGKIPRNSGGSYDSSANTGTALRRLAPRPVPSLPLAGRDREGGLQAQLFPLRLPRPFVTGGGRDTRVRGTSV